MTQMTPNIIKPDLMYGDGNPPICLFRNLGAKSTAQWDHDTHEPFSLYCRPDWSCWQTYIHHKKPGHQKLRPPTLLAPSRAATTPPGRSSLDHSSAGRSARPVTGAALVRLDGPLPCPPTPDLQGHCTKLARPFTSPSAMISGLLGHERRTYANCHCTTARHAPHTRTHRIEPPSHVQLLNSSTSAAPLSGGLQSQPAC